MNPETVVSRGSSPVPERDCTPTRHTQQGGGCHWGCLALEECGEPVIARLAEMARFAALSTCTSRQEGLAAWSRASQCGVTHMGGVRAAISAVLRWFRTLGTQVVNQGAPLLKGPDGHLNWRCSESRLPVADLVEVALYSDARLIGHGMMGPYRIINTIPTDRSEPLPMAAVLRMEWCIPERDPLPDMEKSNQDTFHGGSVLDELAALISLALGVRIQAGGVVREFRDENEPSGTPVQHGHRRPALPPARETQIPTLASGDLRELETVLSVYPRVDPAKAIEVVRCARAFQQGVWMADADPEYAWLKFVSALETAANCWWRGDNDAEAALRYSKPDLAEILEASGGTRLVQDVGEVLRDQLRATRRFLAFFERYKPAPPPIRPAPAFRANWNELDKAMRQIYGYRSKSLHAGLPFPAPMLSEPRILVEGEAAAPERPLGLASAMGSAVWQANELPMFLHVFEHITRTMLLSWLHDTEQGPVSHT